jgi:polysaccharide deacetylase 2 family uncharacterized protein YibQ
MDGLMIRLANTFVLLFFLVSFTTGRVESAELKYPLLVEPAPEKQQPAQTSIEPPADSASAEPVKVPADPPLTESVKPAAPTSLADTETIAVDIPPRFIALIIDDLGNQRVAGERTVALLGPVACAIMPHTSHAAYLAEQAHAAGKEVMLHLPMQPIQMERIAGPGEISLDTQRRDLSRILQLDLDSVPHTVGVNNHMGSLITRHPGHMRWLMEELKRRGNLFFIDSYTTPASVAYEIAIEKGVPAARRHVFLDNEATEAQVARQFQKLKQKANQHGSAIGIGHPYPVTLAFLEQELPLLSEQGYKLVPIATIIDLQPDQHSDAAASRATSDLRQVSSSVY